jgi:hypothetical protein
LVLKYCQAFEFSEIPTNICSSAFGSNFECCSSGTMTQHFVPNSSNHEISAFFLKNASCGVIAFPKARVGNWFLI